MGCAPSAYATLHRLNQERSAGGTGPRRLSMRPHSLETRILQVDQVDSLRVEPTAGDPEAPFVDGMLGIGDLSPTAAANIPTGTFFEDPDFVVDYFKRIPEMGLKRLTRSGERPRVAVWSGECRGRVRAGSFDSRWLAEAMAVVSLRPRLLDAVFRDEATGLPGALRLRLWRFGRWETVVVDDRVPAKQAISSEAEGEVWPALLEKAFAKIHGGYAGLSGGDVLWGIEDLTGGVARRLLEPKGAAEPQRRHASHSADRWETESAYTAVYKPLVQGLRAEALVTCSPKRTQKETQKREISVSSVIDTKLTLTGPQICVLDSFGGTTHWLSLEEFLANYSNIIITTLSAPSDKIQVHQEYGWWESGVSAGGSRNNLEKFAINPQYSLTISKPGEHEENKDFGRCSLLIALMQEHRRSARGLRPPTIPIAYFIYKAEVAGERLGAEYFLCVPEEIKTGHYTNKREIAHQADLEPGNYVVIPATWSPGQQSGFLLRIFSVRKISLEALPSFKPTCAMLPTWVPVTED